MLKNTAMTSREQEECCDNKMHSFYFKLCPLSLPFPSQVPGFQLAVFGIATQDVLVAFLSHQADIKDGNWLK